MGWSCAPGFGSNMLQHVVHQRRVLLRTCRDVSFYIAPALQQRATRVILVHGIFYRAIARRTHYEFELAPVRKVFWCDVFVPVRGALLRRHSKSFERLVPWSSSLARRSPHSTPFAKLFYGINVHGKRRQHASSAEFAAITLPRLESIS